jgi:tetratricopeptide (TPR) repeat protein
LNKVKIILPLVALPVVLITTFVFHLTQSYYKNYHIGRRHFEKGEYALAVDYLLFALKENPQSEEALFALARNYVNLGTPGKAAPLLDRLIRLYPDCLSLQEEEGCSSFEFAADVYLWAGEYGKAISLYEDIINSGNEDREIILKIADALRMAGKYEDAVSFYKDYLGE